MHRKGAKLGCFSPKLRLIRSNEQPFLPPWRLSFFIFPTPTAVLHILLSREGKKSGARIGWNEAVWEKKKERKGQGERRRRGDLGTVRNKRGKTAHCPGKMAKFLGVNNCFKLPRLALSQINHHRQPGLNHFFPCLALKWSTISFVSLARFQIRGQRAPAPVKFWRRNGFRAPRFGSKKLVNQPHEVN